MEYSSLLSGRLSIGGEAKQPVPKLDNNGKKVAYWTPEEAVLEGNYPNLVGYVRNLAEGEPASAGTLDEVTEHLSAYNKTLMQTVAQTLNISYHRIKYPTDGAKAMRDASLKVEAMAEKDARWIFGLIALCLVLVGWFWQKMTMKVFAKSSSAVQA